MLTLTIKSGGWFTVGEARVYVTVKGRDVKVAIDAPREIAIRRAELQERDSRAA